MPWVRFLEKFSWVPPDLPQVSIAYLPGVRLVTTPCAEEAILKGKAERIAKPKGGADGRG